MGMSKEQRQIYAQLTAAITNMQKPQENKAQDFLTTSAMDAANTLKGGEYTSLPKGMFFNFQMPAQQQEMYKKYANVNQGGTFALANNGMDTAGRTQATALQGKYLSDKFARDTGNMLQQNVEGATANVFGALGQSSAYKSNNDANVVNALQGLLGSKAIQKTDWVGSLLGAAGTALSGTKF